MLSGDFPTLSQTQARHAQYSDHIGIPCGEEMSMDKRGTFHTLFGKAPPTQGGTAKKSSSALASTLSTCQVPGGTSLLVGCVLGKTLIKPKQQIRGSIKRKPSERRKELLETSPHDSDGKGRTGILTLPRSISINGPRIANLNSPPPPPPPQKFLGTTMTFLFDKVASVTDCRSTGHFVLPKRKVEEHFPPINKPGGIWMTLVDASGKEWSFEFCFWHSKESRIYYFKKFYPYVQSTDLRGGDTVFFSRLEPQGTLFMGYRKQKPPPPKQIKALNGGASKDQFKEREHSNGGLTYLANDWSPSLDEVAPRQEKPAIMSADDVNAEYTHRKRKRKKEFPPISLAQRTKVIDHLAVGEAQTDRKSTGRRSVTPEAFQHVDRVAGILGSKGKRLRVNLDEYSEWKDTQDLLRPAPGAVPIVVSIDGHDFEEYEEPPVLIKRTYYCPEAHGESQWVKCDDCGSWRRLPADAFVPARWICSDNDRDLRRAYCNAPQELSDHEIDQLLRLDPLDTGDHISTHTTQPRGSYQTNPSAVKRTEGRTESQEELYDDGDWTTSEHQSAHDRDACAYQQPALWSAAMALVDGSLQRSTSQSEIKNCSSYTSDPESLSRGAGNTLQSPRLQQFCDLIEDPTPLTERTYFIAAGAEKDYQTSAEKDYEISTDCDEFLASSGTGEGYDVPTPDCYDFLGPPGKLLLYQTNRRVCNEAGGTLAEYGAERKLQANFQS